jgi:inositol-pentakisphosphate 2-kinase
LIKVDKNFVSLLSENLEKYRPQHRKIKSIDLECEYALLMSDLTKLSTQDSMLEDDEIITVEIKPKWGIICESIYIKNEHSSAKYQYCRYCMHQHLKFDEVF